MKTYPSIEHHNNKFIGRDVFVFDKLDGSNLRFEYSKKSGWYKFGTRKELINEKTPIYGEAINLFLNKYSENLNKVFNDKYSKVLNFVVFCEFHGENSFSGKHLESDKKDITLFDINAYKIGFIEPSEFIDNFSKFDIPKLIYTGEYNNELIYNVKNNIWDLKEGVICKGVLKSKKNVKEIWMSKLKTNEWLNKVKSQYGIIALKEEFNGKIPLIYN